MKAVEIDHKALVVGNKSPGPTRGGALRWSVSLQHFWKRKKEYQLFELDHDGFGIVANSTPP